MGLYDWWKNRNPSVSEKRIANIEFALKAVDPFLKNMVTPFLATSGRRQLTIQAGTRFEFGTGTNARTYYASANTNLTVTSIMDSGSLAAGRDYYLFACPGSTAADVVFRVSLTKTAPSGFLAANVLLIGGFHTLCVGVGSGLTYMEGNVSRAHPLAGFVAADILPQSVWCLNHRPYSEPEGMVYIPYLDFWCDIYLQSGSGANTKSAYQGAITRSRQYVDFVEDQLCVKKALLNDEEFAAAMMGSNEQTSVAGASEAGATSGGAGGRSDTASRRMISIHGVEEGCGSLWQWLASTSAAGGTGWVTQSGGKGNYHGNCFVLLAGGYWIDGAYCGSRARYASNSRAYSDAAIGGRGRSRPKFGL